MPTALKQALRSLRLSPAFTVTVIVTLGIGIGLNAAIFTVVDNVLLRPLGYHDADRIVALRTHFNKEGRFTPRLGGPDYEDLVHNVRGLESVAYYEDNHEGVFVNGAAVYTNVTAVSPRFTEVMGVQAVAGRLLNPADRDGRDALVSEDFARRYLGPAPVGSSITHAGLLFTVAGVLPQGFDFPARTELWLEAPATQILSSRTSYNYHVVGKRLPGVSAAALDAELATFSTQLQHQYEDDRFKSIEAVSLQEQLTGRIRPTLNLLMGSVAVILLIVCANITHLQLVRATRQLRAITIRTALGASRSALTVRALVETVLLAAAGTALALLLAVPGLRLLVHMAPVNTPRLADIHLNGDVLLFSLAVTLLVMLATALLPLWRSWHIDPASALRADASRGTESRASLRLRSSFIVAEVALTLTLSVAALLLTRQLIAQSHQDLGFATESLVTLDTHAIVPTTLPLPLPTADTAEAKGAEVERTRRQAENVTRLSSLLDETAAVPGVSAAAAIAGAPIGFDSPDAGYAIRGRTEFNSHDELPDADMRSVTPNLFSTLRIPLLRGRYLTPDDRSGAPPTVVINQELARESFPNQNPIGQQIKFGYDFAVPVWTTIVGVVGDVRSRSPMQLPRPAVYFTFAQHPRDAADVQIVVRTTLAPEVLARTLTHAHRELAVAGSTMQQQLGEVGQTDHFRTALFSLFAAVSILLAAIGMYGVTAYSVAQRRFEYGLRIALGANRSQLLGMVLRSGFLLAATGVAAGVLLSLGLQRVLTSLLGKLPAFDAVAYLSASLAVLAIALAATLIPARRAAGVDPMQVLRSE